MDSQGPTGRRTRCRAGRPAALTLAWRALALIASLAASNVHAQALHEFVVHELAPPVESKLQGWQTAAGLGYVGVTGNEPSTTVTARVRARYRAALWTNTIRINMLRTQVPGGSPVNRFSAMNQTRYRIGRASYVLGLEGVDRDPASGFDRRYTAVLGYGHQWWAGQDRSLRAEVGLGTRFSHLTNGTRQHELIGLAALYYQVQLSPDLSLSQGLLIEPGNLDVYVQSNTALHERLTQRLSLVLSFGINHDSKPPPGVLLKTNTITAVSLQYGF
ncbi:MAG TPA: DUF481 domain-containing protein [Acidiferrobacteraceae bacterium]|nr:DUF481 domain-containing protein [Acidiferrobacteraceae bacterium]